MEWLGDVVALGLFFFFLVVFPVWFVWSFLSRLWRSETRK